MKGSSELGARALRAGSGLGVGADSRSALARAVDECLLAIGGARPDLLLLFASAVYEDDYADLLAEAAARSGATEIAGCSAWGVIAGEREVETEPGLAALALALPSGAWLSVRHVAMEQTSESQLLGVSAGECTGIIVLADPFTSDVGEMISALERDYPGAPIVGGMATGVPGAQRTCLFRGSEVLEEGAVVISLGGTVRLKPLVSQGCEPIGEAWTITDATGHLVRSIGGRPPSEVLLETIKGLDPERQQRVNGNLLVGLAMDEYRDEFKRGDFLIRNPIGIDQTTGALAISGQPRVGQTIQFQIRDARAADDELRHMLGRVSADASAAALLFACNGRGVGLFGAADHDARTVREVLGPVPLAGLFCNGEIGPVGTNTYIHGFTASLALLESVPERR